jgi:uncharacterized protein with HEPN domain
VKGPRPAEARLRDIVAYGERLARHLDGVSRGEFPSNELTQDAVAKCVEAIGEAAGQITRIAPDLESRHPELRLTDAYSARNRLSHGYHSIDYGVDEHQDLSYRPSMKALSTARAAAGCVRASAPGRRRPPSRRETASPLRAPVHAEGPGVRSPSCLHAAATPSVPPRRSTSGSFT